VVVHDIYHQSLYAVYVHASALMACCLLVLLSMSMLAVESTARKNLLLQQTIKAILRCLQQEGVAPAAAAAAASTAAAMANSRAASPLSVAAGSAAAAAAGVGVAGVPQLQQCISFSLDAQIAAAAASTAACADGAAQHEEEEDLPGADGQRSCSSGCDEQQQEVHIDGPLSPQLSHRPPASPGQQQNQQQQLFDTHARVPPVPDVAGDIVQQLQQRVVMLGDELAAAQQALAAALQGMMPEGCAARVVVLPGAADCTAAAAAGRSAACTSPGHAGRSSLLLWDEGNSGGPVGRFQPPHQQPQQLQKCNAVQDSSNPGWGSGRSGGNTSSSSSRAGQACSRGSSPVSAVRQRGAGSRTPDSSRPHKSAAGASGGGAAALSAALDDGVAAFVLYCIQQLRRGAGTSLGIQQQQQASSAASPSVCSSPVSCRASCSRSFAARAVVDSDAAAAAAMREQLARLLLDELHGYAQHKVAAFRGLGLALPGQQGEEGQAAGGGADEAETAAARLCTANAGQPGDDAAAGGEAADAEVWLLQQLSKEQQQVLPPLPSLLSMAQLAPAAAAAFRHTAAQGMGSPGRAPSPHSAAAAAAGGDSSSTGSASQLRLSREDLFSAVLADVRPWGGSSSSKAHQLISAARGPGSCAGLPRQQQEQQQQSQRSRTPTSPAGVQQHSSCAPAAAAVAGARSPKALSPKPLSPEHGHPPGGSSGSRGSAGSMCGSLSPSAGRLARAAEAAGSCTADSSLKGALQVKGQPGGP
jgi:hypothetical protein